LLMKTTYFKLLIIFYLIFPSQLFAQSKKMDVNDDGNFETVYFNTGKPYFFKVAFDFDNDGKSDILLSINENTGEFLSIDIDRSTWPITSNLGSSEWIKEKKDHSHKFWNEGGPHGTHVYDKSGKFLFTIPPHDHSRNTCICDICNATVMRNQGYLLSTQDVFSNPDYINRKDPMATMFGQNPVELQLTFLQQLFITGINTPWMLCDDCFNVWKKLK
jgi:hypothetical protein